MKITKQVTKKNSHSINLNYKLWEFYLLYGPRPKKGLPTFSLHIKCFETQVVVVHTCIVFFFFFFKKERGLHDSLFLPKTAHLGFQSKWISFACQGSIFYLHRPRGVFDVASKTLHFSMHNTSSICRG